jgi:hypothetical protein
MNVKRTALAVALALIATSAAALARGATPAPGAQDDKAADIVGKWEGVAKNTPDGDSPFTMELASEGGKVACVLSGPHGTFRGKDGSYADGKLTVSLYSAEGVPLTITGTYAEDKLTGEWDAGSYGRGPYEATRAKAAAPAK